MLETSARLLRLLSLLQARGDRTGPELAKHLDIDVRTVRRDIERLRTLGYPVHATTGVIGGYRLGAGTTLPPLLLDDDEAVAMVVALRTAAGLSGIEETSTRALVKLEQVLPVRLRRRVNALNHATMTLARPGPDVAVDVLTVIAGACRDYARLRFSYTTRADHTGERTVEPLRLACTGQRWYLLAYDLDRGDWRTFRVDRMTGTPETSFRFTPREPPTEDIAAFITHAITSAPYQYLLRILVHAPAATVAGLVPSDIGMIEAVDEDRCVLHVSTHDLEGLTFGLAQHSFDFEIEGPPELIERLHLIAERFARALRRSPAT
ncbi:helix-turn-helix transcriptional regulator [Streptomyces sp. NPDC057199]|uniref:helix-turn-helix transcriptional regulator n=1 Tax=Streptomyces sp. NPDC057199 TaxID=3346047 RepID=UPI003628E01B